MKNTNKTMGARPAAATPGQGQPDALPEGVAGWSWGAFVFSWIWALGNRTWIGLLGLIPGVGLVVRVALGLKGRQLAWRNKRWASVAHFNRVQRRWNIAAGAFLLLSVIGIAAAIGIPVYQDRQAREQLGEAVRYANKAAEAVGRHIASNRTVPRTLDDAGFRQPLPASLERLTIRPQDGQLQLAVGIERLRGQAFYLAPAREADGSITWRCLHGDIPSRLLPKQCNIHVGEQLEL